MGILSDNVSSNFSNIDLSSVTVVNGAAISSEKFRFLCGGA